MLTEEALKFEEFKNTVRDGIENGSINFERPATDFDLAVIYAVGLIGDERGYPYETSIDEIYEKMLTFADDDIFNEE